jgi:hypothetical protein
LHGEFTSQYNAELLELVEKLRPGIFDANDPQYI